MCSSDLTSMFAEDMEFCAQLGFENPPFDTAKVCLARCRRLPRQDLRDRIQSTVVPVLERPLHFQTVVHLSSFVFAGNCPQTLFVRNSLLSISQGLGVLRIC